MRIVKWLLVALGFAAAAVVALVGFVFWDAAQNRGWEVGYYGQYNWMRHLLLELPGVEIVNERHTHDVVLEEFEFALMVHGAPVRLYFSEPDSVRTMARDAARENLRAWIADELAAAAPVTPKAYAQARPAPSPLEGSNHPNATPR